MSEQLSPMPVLFWILPKERQVVCWCSELGIVVHWTNWN